MTKLLATLFTIILLPQLASGAGFLEELAKGYLGSDQGFELVVENLGLKVKANKIESYEEGSSVGDDLSVRQTIKLKRKGFQDVVLHARFPSSPESLPANVPVIFLVSGYNTHLQSLEMFPSSADAIVVSYQYPLSDEKVSQALEAENIGNLINVPEQLVRSLTWLSGQAWTSKYNLNVIAISLGGFFLPVSQRAAESQGVYVNSSVYAYTGGSIAELLRYEIENNFGTNETQIAMDSLEILLSPFSPDQHLPRLGGKFLAISGSADSVIPERSARAVGRSLPEPKEIMILPGQHISLDRPDVIDLFTETIESWYAQIGVFN